MLHSKWTSSLNTEIHHFHDIFMSKLWTLFMESCTFGACV